MYTYSQCPKVLKSSISIVYHNEFDCLFDADGIMAMCRNCLGQIAIEHNELEDTITNYQCCFDLCTPGICHEVINHTGDLDTNRCGFALQLCPQAHRGVFQLSVALPPAKAKGWLRLALPQRLPTMST